MKRKKHPRKKRMIRKRILLVGEILCILAVVFFGFLQKPLFTEKSPAASEAPDLENIMPEILADSETST